MNEFKIIQQNVQTILSKLRWALLFNEVYFDKYSMHYIKSEILRISQWKIILLLNFFIFILPYDDIKIFILLVKATLFSFLFLHFLDFATIGDQLFSNWVQKLSVHHTNSSI